MHDKFANLVQVYQWWVWQRQFFCNFVSSQFANGEFTNVLFVSEELANGDFANGKLAISKLANLVCICQQQSLTKAIISRFCQRKVCQWRVCHLSACQWWVCLSFECLPMVSFVSSSLQMANLSVASLQMANLSVASMQMLCLSVESLPMQIFSGKFANCDLFSEDRLLTHSYVLVITHSIITRSISPPDLLIFLSLPFLSQDGICVCIESKNE